MIEEKKVEIEAFKEGNKNDKTIIILRCYNPLLTPIQNNPTNWIRLQPTITRNCYDLQSENKFIFPKTLRHRPFQTYTLANLHNHKPMLSHTYISTESYCTIYICVCEKRIPQSHFLLSKQINWLSSSLNHLNVLFSLFGIFKILVTFLFFLSLRK